MEVLEDTAVVSCFSLTEMLVMRSESSESLRFLAGGGSERSGAGIARVLGAQVGAMAESFRKSGPWDSQGDGCTEASYIHSLSIVIERLSWKTTEAKLKQRRAASSCTSTRAHLRPHASHMQRDHKNMYKLDRYTKPGRKQYKS